MVHTTCNIDPEGNIALVHITEDSFERVTEQLALQHMRPADTAEVEQLRLCLHEIRTKPGLIIPAFGSVIGIIGHFGHVARLTSVSAIIPDGSAVFIRMEHSD